MINKCNVELTMLLFVYKNFFLGLGVRPSPIKLTAMIPVFLIDKYFLL